MDQTITSYKMPKPLKNCAVEKTESSDVPSVSIQEISSGLLEQMGALMVHCAGQLPALARVYQPAMASFDLQGVAQLIASGRARRIICMCGAGISVSAGIPDFRSPGSGLYHRLQQYDLPHPEAVFEIGFFRSNPRPFYLLARELFPGTFSPTPTHYFMRLLHDKGLLLRCYTQNIDSLEQQAGLPREAVVAAHGNFDRARCVRCGTRHSVEHVRRAVFRGNGHPCFCRVCGGLVKPDIVFFGEGLPPRFFRQVPRDFPRADLLIVMGTSLVVQPFASLLDEVRPTTPRLLINRERAGEGHPLLRSLGCATGFNFDQGNCRDALFEGDCDEGVRQLCRALGWEGELEELMAAGPRGSPGKDLREVLWRGGLPGAGKPGRRARRRRELLHLHRMLCLARLKSSGRQQHRRRRLDV